MFTTRKLYLMLHVFFFQWTFQNCTFLDSNETGSRKSKEVKNRNDCDRYVLYTDIQYCSV